ncbi:zona pellucida sperm-binding protein 1-like [Trachemys scripta elegans]|uniref:zona pellucida sperm-binding protein 1-like n=1 Tax=Trachemys scripta elegans TaxID=31138 RepID=UPI0015520BF6|nr:zona pellucida sperm-binding protein 1-like [Trachemys scripta elegans]
MGLGCRYFVSLVLLWSLGTALGQGDFLGISFSVLQRGYEYDCGDYGMQLLVFPSPGRTVRFKVVDEFGTAFEVTNCSICLHWVTSPQEGAVIFSAGYNGCHVLKKDGRNHLRVRVEELLSTRAVAATRDVNMTCPKPTEHDLTPEETMRYVPQPQPGLVRPVPQPQPGLVRPVPQPQPGLVRLVPQPQPGLVRPVPQPQPGLVPYIYPPLSNIGARLTPEQCQVVAGKIPCANALDQAACFQAGCCYDGTDPTTPCYYGNTVTLQCLMDGHFILVVSRDMSDHPIILDNVRLAYAQAGCNPISMTEAFVLFRFPVTQCGTTVQVIGDKLIYENQLISGIDIQTGPQGSITRDSTFILHARCIYNASDFLPVQVKVFLPPIPAPVTQAGPLRFELRIATDLSYTSYLTERDYPVVKVLRDPVYVEVRILQRTDPSLVLVLHQCWATPSANPLQQPQWPILVDGCPFLGDNYRTQLVPMGPASSELPFPTHYQRFVLSTFAFVDSTSQMVLEGLVYIFCSAAACSPSQLESCKTICPSGVTARGRRFLTIQNETEPVNVVSSRGPVTFQNSPEAFKEPVYQSHPSAHLTKPQSHRFPNYEKWLWGRASSLTPSTMGLGCRYFVGLVLLWSLGTALGQGDFRRVSFSVLQRGYEYDCGDYGMQLLVLPSQDRTVRFKVVDEFGTPFEVTNCSICLHWIASGEKGEVIFSAGYNGCHVLKQDGRNHLRVRVEELLSTGAIAATRDVTMTCPKPTEHDLSPEETMRYVPQPQPGLVRPVPQPQPQPGLVRPVPQPQPQPGLVRPVPQPQPGLVRPVPHIYPPPSSIGAHLTQEQCHVVAGKIPCADAPGRAACFQAGCCYDETDPTTLCYYGNTVTVQCLVDGHFVLVVSRDMSDHPIILDSVRLAYAQTGCDPIRKTEAFVIFRFPLLQCGTTIQVIHDKLIYENQLISGIDIQTGPDGSITRDSTFILHARCIYNASDFLPVQVEVFLPPTPAPVTQAGPLRLELRIATDVSYTSYLTERDYPVVKVLRDPVFVEVRILQRTDPSLVLVLHQCWATPSASPLQQPQWPILVDGCPFLGDNYRTQLVPMVPASSELPFPTHHQRFVLSTFAFVDSASQVVLDGQVYIYCSASTCYPSQLEPCRTMCPSGAATRGRRFLNINNGTGEPQDLVRSHGPMIFQESPEPWREQVYENMGEAAG